MINEFIPQETIEQRIFVIRGQKVMFDKDLAVLYGMILTSNRAKILLSQGDNFKIRDFLKNIGSNFILKDKKLNFAFNIGWRALIKNSPTDLNMNWLRVFENIRTDNYKV